MTNASPLSSETAIITGGVRGLGLAIAQRLAADGRRVILWDVDVSDFDAALAGFEPLLLVGIAFGCLLANISYFDAAKASFTQLSNVA